MIYCMHVCIHINRHMQACTYTYKQTHKSKHVHEYSRVHTHTHAQTTKYMGKATHYSKFYTSSYIHIEQLLSSSKVFIRVKLAKTLFCIYAMIYCHPTFTLKQEVNWEGEIFVIEVIFIMLLAILGKSENFLGGGLPSNNSEINTVLIFTWWISILV